MGRTITAHHRGINKDQDGAKHSRYRQTNHRSHKGHTEMLRQVSNDIIDRVRC